MTREEFEQFMDGEQWTPQQRATFSRFTPTGTPSVVRQEMTRPDGVIEVSLIRRPRVERFRRHFAIYRKSGVPLLASICGAWRLSFGDLSG